MRSYNLKHTLTSLFITVIILVLTDILFSTIFPLIGLMDFRFSLNMLIVLYLGFKLDHPFLAILVFVIQYFHSLFTIEGWAMGTFSGVLVCIIIGIVREIIHFNSKFMVILIVQIFQIVWFVIMAGMVYLKLGDTHYVLVKLMNFIPASVALSLLSPFFFSLFDRIWRVQADQMLEGEA